MENKRRPKGLAAFLAGKGFYIALTLCAVAIGVTAWAMVSRAKTVVETQPEINWSDLDAYRASEYTPENPFVSASPELNGGEPLDVPDSGNPNNQAGNTDSQAGETDITPSAPETQQDGPAEPVWNPDDAGMQVQQSFYWPLNGEIDMPYAADTLLYNRTLSDWRTHEGVDIAAELGAQVMAAANGRVEHIYNDDLFGTTVVIDHTGGLKSVYSNLAEMPTVAVGDGVVAGEIIGSVGTTALAETNAGTHLHFAMTLDGQSIDPLEYMP